MSVTIAAVVSVDGRLTKHDDPDVGIWTSAEDQAHFKSLIEVSDVIVMGSGTYEVIRGKSPLGNGKLRVVLTSTPDKYAKDSQPGELEFRNQSASEFVDQENGKKILVAGGTKMMTDFFAEGLVDELQITVEPKIFGTGQTLTDLIPLDVNLELIETKRLNSSGTLLNIYRVVG